MSRSELKYARPLWRWFLVHRIAPLAALGGLLALSYFGFWRYHLKRFYAVRAGSLYRVAQPTEFGFRHLVQHYGIRTVLNIRLEDPWLYEGLIDLGDPDGRLESQYVPRLGIRHIQWPMGEEVYWPWLTPWQFEEFYKLFDNPANLPVAVHCMGGRHRTGTFVALFELEYNRRPVEATLADMYSYDFGPPAWVHDHNLRTYLPRPRPNVVQWEALLNGLFGSNVAAAPADYESLVRQLRAEGCDTAVSGRFHAYFQQQGPFALCLAQRLIDVPDHLLAKESAALASEQLQAAADDPMTWAMSAAIVADFGTPAQQQALYKVLEQEPKDKPATPRYQAIVAGVTNRYTPNRIAYLLPLLTDRRQRPEPAAGRYCDTAVARLTSITNERVFPELLPPQSAWNEGVVNAQRWFEQHPDSKRFVQLQPPSGKNIVRAMSGNEQDGRNWLR